MTQIFYDFEFIEDGRTIEPISLGMVRSTGEAYYAVFSDAPWERIRKHEWLMQNVAPHLPSSDGPYRDGSSWEFEIDTKSTMVKPGWVIANEVREFTLVAHEDSRLKKEKLELWADTSDYDHVCLMQMFGSMINKPGHLPYFTFDVQQEMERLGVEESSVVKQAAGSEHNALCDAEQAHRKWKRCKEVREAEKIILHRKEEF